MTDRTTGHAKVMLIDDTPANLQLLTRMLQKQGYELRVFPRGRLALTAALENPPDLVLLDINMPEMDGYEVCRRFKQNDRLAEIPIIFISAYNETLDKVRAFDCGGADYVTKPFEFEEVQARVKTHLELRRARLELKHQNDRLQQRVDAQVRDILAAKEELSQAQLATILAMSKLAASRDDDTGRHIERVQGYCRLLALRLRTCEGLAATLDDEFIHNLYHASPLHDIGKVAIPDDILKKPGRLTPEESAIMQTHTVLGAATLEAVYLNYPSNGFIRMGMDIARSHHEKWDGSGYPDGLAGDAIPLAAQIMGLVDVYDALRSPRCYKPAFTHEQSRDIILAAEGTQFAPKLVQAFVDIQGQFAAVSAG
jgi:putative two-component system response regulator